MENTQYILGDVIETDCYSCDVGDKAKVVAMGPNYVTYECTYCGMIDYTTWSIVIQGE